MKITRNYVLILVLVSCSTITPRAINMFKTIAKYPVKALILTPVAYSIYTHSETLPNDTSKAVQDFNTAPTLLTKARVIGKTSLNAMYAFKNDVYTFIKLCIEAHEESKSAQK